MIYYQRDNSLTNYNFNIIRYDNYNFACHFHSNPEIIYCISGEIELTVDGKSEIIKAGEFGMVLSNQIHFFKTANLSSIYIIVFSPDYVAEFVKRMRRKCGDRLVFSCSNAVRELFLNTVTDSSAQTVYMMKACLYALIDQYTKCVTIIENSVEYSDLRYKIMEYITQNYKNDINLSHMSDFLGYDYHYISKQFRKCFNMSFSNFVNMCRINYAIELLSSSDTAITTIATECGFNSLRNFNRAFFKIVGNQPREFRKSVSCTFRQ